MCLSSAATLSASVPPPLQLITATEQRCVFHFYALKSFISLGLFVLIQYLNSAPSLSNSLFRYHSPRPALSYKYEIWDWGQSHYRQDKDRPSNINIFFSLSFSLSLPPWLSVFTQTYLIVHYILNVRERGKRMDSMTIFFSSPSLLPSALFKYWVFRMSGR